MCALVRNMGKRLLLMRAFQIKIPEQSFKLGQLDTPFMKLRSSLRHVGYGNAVAPFVVRISMESA